MTSPGEEASVTSDFVRSYVITGGRTLPAADDLALHTLVTLAPDRTPPLGAGPEVTAIWKLCAGGYLSVAEVAGHLGLGGGGPAAADRLIRAGPPAAPRRAAPGSER